MEVQRRRVPAKTSVRQRVPELFLDLQERMVDLLCLVVGAKIEYPLELVRPKGADKVGEALFRRIEVAEREHQNQHVLQITEVRFERGAGVKEPFSVRP